MSNHRIIHGDSTEVLKTLDENSIDLIATDPPYGYSFMGADWDKAVPSIEVWQECLRVLKPGAFMFVMSAPRSDVQCEMVRRIQEAGFRMDFTPIYWTYACLSDDTEVLTESGWKPYKSISSDDKICVYDADKDIYHFEKPEAWNEYQIKDTLVRIRGNHTDQLVTRNHRCLIERDGSIVFQEAGQINGRVNVPYLESVSKLRGVLPHSQNHFTEATKKSAKQTKRNLLLSTLPPKRTYDKTTSRWRYSPSSMDRRTQKEMCGYVHWCRQSLMEGRRNLLQDTRKLFGREVCSLPTRVQGHGTQGRLCHGTPSICCTNSWQNTSAFGMRASHRPRPDEQRHNQSHAVQIKQRPQKVRTRASYRTDMATITHEEYEGRVFCPTVSTGAFVARRNGHIFVTGNSGFPKAMNISKVVDKKAGQSLDWFLDFAIDEAKKQGKTLRDLQMLFPSKNGNPTGWLWNKRNHQSITLEQYNVIKEFLNLPFDTLEEAEREVIGKKTVGVKDGSAGGSQSYGLKATDVDVTIPCSELAKDLEGSYAGYQPKPAVEVILVAMKPLNAKNYVEQAMQNKKGITWLDDCGIPTSDEVSNHSRSSEAAVSKGKYGDSSEQETHQTDRQKDGRRFAANLLVSDDMLNDGTFSTSSGGKHSGKKGTRDNVGEYGYDRVEISRPTDSGSASRFFSLDAWWTGLVDKLPANIQKTFPFMMVSKPNSNERHGWIEDKNIHPTTKPLALMSYLVTLGSRPEDTVLDPFVGSGTTCVAAKSINRNCIGIEREEEYVRIAEQRLNAVGTQISLFE